MNNYELLADEVILYEGISSITIIDEKKISHALQVTLTSKKLIFEKEKGIFKKERELIDIILLENVKLYNDTVQVKQKTTIVIKKYTRCTLIFHAFLYFSYFSHHHIRNASRLM